jgi:hypothetical protein
LAAGQAKFWFETVTLPCEMSQLIEVEAMWGLPEASRAHCSTIRRRLRDRLDKGEMNSKKKLRWWKLAIARYFDHRWLLRYCSSYALQTAQEIHISPARAFHREIIEGWIFCQLTTEWSTCTWTYKLICVDMDMRDCNFRIWFPYRDITILISIFDPDSLQFSLRNFMVASHQKGRLDCNDQDFRTRRSSRLIGRISFALLNSIASNSKTPCTANNVNQWVYSC